MAGGNRSSPRGSDARSPPEWGGGRGSRPGRDSYWESQRGSSCAPASARTCAVCPEDGRCSASPRTKLYTACSFRSTAVSPSPWFLYLLVSQPKG